MDKGYRPDSYVDTHPKPAKSGKPKMGKTPVGVSPVVQMKDDLRAMASAKDMLAAELEYTRKELEEDVARIAALERENAKIGVALRGALQAQDELERERTLLRAQIADLTRALEAMTAERDDLLRQVALLKARIAELESQLAASQERERQLQQQLERERQEAADRYSTLARESSDTAEKQRIRIEELSTERDGLKARVATLEAQVARLEKSEAELTRLNHQYQLQLQVVKRETQREEGAAASKKQRELLQQDELEMGRLRVTAVVNGTFVDKYCRNGKVHQVHMRITPDKKELVWRDVTQAVAGERRIVLDEVTHIVHGLTTPVFTRILKEPTDEQRHRAFSLVTATRTLDVMAAAEDVCNLWLKALTTILPLQVETA